MRKLPMVLIPKNYPKFTARRVHTAQWVDGEKVVIVVVFFYIYIYFYFNSSLNQKRMMSVL